MLDSSKLKEFVGKGETACNEQFLIFRTMFSTLSDNLSVYPFVNIFGISTKKKIVLQTRKNQGLFGKKVKGVKFCHCVAKNYSICAGNA